MERCDSCNTPVAERYNVLKHDGGGGGGGQDEDGAQVYNNGGGGASFTTRPLR